MPCAQHGCAQLADARISPAFHLKVIRAYDRLATQGVAVHESAAGDLLKDAEGREACRERMQGDRVDVSFIKVLTTPDDKADRQHG